MSTPGFNHLKTALKYIKPTPFQFLEFYQNVMRPDGVKIPYFRPAINTRGSIQAVEQSMYKQHKLSFKKTYKAVFAEIGIEPLERDRPSDRIYYLGYVWQVLQDTIWQDVDGWSWFIMVRLDAIPDAQAAKFTLTKAMELSNDNFTAQLTANSTESEPVAWFSDLRPEDNQVYGVYFIINVASFQDGAQEYIGFVNELDFETEDFSAATTALCIDLVVNDAGAGDIDVNLGNLVTPETVGPYNFTYTSQELCIATNGITAQFYVNGSLVLDFTPTTEAANIANMFSYINANASTITDRAATPGPLTIVETPATPISGVNQLMKVVA